MTMNTNSANWHSFWDTIFIRFESPIILIDFTGFFFIHQSFQPFEKWFLSLIPLSPLMCVSKLVVELLSTIDLRIIENISCISDAHFDSLLCPFHWNNEFRSHLSQQYWIIPQNSYHFVCVWSHRIPKFRSTIEIKSFPTI